MINTIYSHDIEVSIYAMDANYVRTELCALPIAEAVELLDSADARREYEADNDMPAGALTHVFFSTGGMNIPDAMTPNTADQLKALAGVCDDLDVYGLNVAEYVAYMAAYDETADTYPSVEGVSESVFWRGDDIEDGARAVYSFENGEDAADQCDADFCFTDWLHSFDCYGLYKVADYDFMGRFGDRCTSFVIFR